MTSRIAIPQFQLANPLYKNATVAFYTAVSGVITPTLASLYADTFSNTQLQNPQKLNSQGQFKAPVYIQDQVIGVVSGISVPSHNTAIIAPPSTGTGTSFILAKLAGASLSTVADQPIAGLPAKYRITEIVITNATGDVTTASGGVNAAAGGASVIAPSQALASLNTAQDLVSLGFNPGALEIAYSAPTLYFTCTVAQGTPMECDVYIMGTPLI